MYYITYLNAITVIHKEFLSGSQWIVRPLRSIVNISIELVPIQQ